MSDVRACGQCGVILPDDSPDGVCPSCLMRLGMGAPDPASTQSHQAGRQPFVPPKPHELADHFPQLEILDLIGQGGMGAVYKARQVGLDRIVALKILPPHTGDDGSFAERFEREARSLARLSHPNIVGVFDSGRAGDFYYFVMEFVDGINLREAIRAEKLTPAEALAIVPQICEALQFAHDEGIVHRDIKPENILIDKKGNTKIADFGLARLLGQTADLTLTGTHQVMGTPRYMAPEQLEGSHKVDHRADIYSLGVVFYEMLTGELPIGRFDGPSKIVRVDVRLDEVVFRALEKEPDRRYQHVSDIKDDVQTICSHAYVAGGTRHGQNYEFKSKAHLFGWPLVHVAFGKDPITGKLLQARGIVAIGNIAYGVIAIGTFAVGGIALGGACAIGGLALGGGAAVGSLAIGGFALGMFSFGGVAIGLLTAVGGLALGLGYSYGGLAVGMIAEGGLGLGWYAKGGSAYGMHALGSNVPYRSSEAESVFASLSSLDAGAVLIGVLIVAATSLGTGTCISIRLLRRKKARPAVEKPPRMEPGTRRANSGIVVALVVIGSLAVLCMLPMLLLTYLWQSFGGVPNVDRLATPTDAAAISYDDAFPDRISAGGYSVGRDWMGSVMSIDDVGWIIWTKDGPQLQPSIAVQGQRLTDSQRDKISQILSDAHQAYVKLEQESSHRSMNEAGHWVNTVKFEDEGKLAELEDQVWTGLDSIVDLAWQKEMRMNLFLRGPGDRAILDFVGRHGSIEIWKVGAWYHWRMDLLRTQPGLNGAAVERVQGHEASGPNLPLRFQRFWIEPVEVRETGDAGTTEADAEGEPTSP